MYLPALCFLTVVVGGFAGGLKVGQAGRLLGLKLGLIEHSEP